MLKCPNCNEDNQIGAIFCRSCGEKINIDDLRPDDIAAASKSGGNSVLKGIKTLVHVIITLSLIGALVSIFLDPGVAQHDEMSKASAEYKKYKMRLGNLMKSASGGYTFSEQEVTQAAKEMLFLTTDDKLQEEQVMGSGLVAVDVDVNLIAPDIARVSLEQRAYDQVTLYSVVDFQITTNQGGGLIFTPAAAKSGKLPCPGPLQEMVVSRLQQRRDNFPDRFNKIQTLVFQKAKGFSISGTSITVQK
jgi:hypothetical protein